MPSCGRGPVLSGSSTLAAALLGGSGVCSRQHFLGGQQGGYALHRQHSRDGARRPRCSVRGGVWAWLGGTWASHAVCGVRACGCPAPHLPSRHVAGGSPCHGLIWWSSFLGRHASGAWFGRPCESESVHILLSPGSGRGGLGIQLLLSQLPYYSSLTHHTQTRSAPLHTCTCLRTPHCGVDVPSPAGLSGLARPPFSLCQLRVALGFATWAPWFFSLLERLCFSPQPEPWLDKCSWVLGSRSLQAAGAPPGLLLSPGVWEGWAAMGPRGQGLVWLSRDTMSSHTWLEPCSPGAQICVLWFGDGLAPQPAHMWLPRPQMFFEGNLGWLTGMFLFSLESLISIVELVCQLGMVEALGACSYPAGCLGLALGLQRPPRWHTR